MKRLSLVLTAFAISATAGAQTLPERVAKTKTIKVAVNPIYPPMESKDPASGNLVGFDIDLGAALAKELGVKLEYQDSAFEQMMPALTTGRADIILSGLYDRPARREQADFVNYLNSGVQFFTQLSRAELKDATDLCGKTIATSRSTSFPAEIKEWSDKNCVAAGKAAINVEGTQDNNAARAGLKQGRYDAVAQGSETVSYITSSLEPNTYKTLGLPFGGAQHGIAIAKNDPQLRDAILAAMRKLVANGTYQDIIVKWNLQTSAVKQVGLNGAPQP
ncbi:ABC transporter substrate-binding protein [Variovorax sp. J31P207]|uniref:ABC transporter substrate-binding protein n=1 Tax=Variovorax sp. J31P207 TaxID=3053510 RepID=UPI002578AEC9|nr:ABC transporter substrate-binding protein [Variovorax sp. J31P207]MDM0071584.1 ABC transporter substrate-binding protein [Variovorax sp. J31P207]